MYSACLPESSAMGDIARVVFGVVEGIFFFLPSKIWAVYPSASGGGSRLDSIALLLQ